MPFAPVTLAHRGSGGLFQPDVTLLEDGLMSANVEVNRDYGWLAGYCRANRIDTPTRHEAEQAVADLHGGDWRRYGDSLLTQAALRHPAPRRGASKLR
jgi:hypothetical protein